MLQDFDYLGYSHDSPLKFCLILPIKHTELIIMVIQHNLNALTTLKHLNFSTNQVRKSTERLASGLRINRASDDPAGLAISVKMRARIRGLQQAIRNANDGISLIQTAEGALNEVHVMLHRLKELTVQAANGIWSDDERRYMQMEVDQILDEIGRTSKATDFNGIRLLDGSLGEVNRPDTPDTPDIPDIPDTPDTPDAPDNGLILQIGANNAPYNRMVVNINAVNADSLGIASLCVRTAQSARESIGMVDGAITAVSRQRAALGAMQNRLEHTVNSLTNQAENLMAAESRIRDADMAAEMLNYTRYTLLQQVAQALLAQAIQAPQAVLQLLR
jgi:flagellin